MAKKHRQGKTRSGRRGARERQLVTIRYGILAAAAAIVGALLIWGVLYSSGAGDGGGIAEDDDYRVVEDPPRRRPDDPIVVTEFFSYGCIHCRAFDPLIEDWRGSLPEDAVFERAPVAFSVEWAVLGQAYLALVETGALAANHERIFRAIHDNGRTFLTANQIADFVDGNGVTRQAFLDAFNSSAVRRTLARNEARQRQLGITSVPSLAVADAYVVNMNVGRRRALEVASQLIGLVRSGGEQTGGVPVSQP